MKDIRIMSHNVWGMFAPDVVKSVDNRSSLMWEIYSEYLPDVIGTQEFSRDIRNSGLVESMSEVYAELDVSADIERYGMTNLFTPVFYNKNTCAVLEKGFILFDREYNNHDSKGAVWAVMRHLPTESVFSIANTHYWWKSGEEHDAARVKNSDVILKLMKKLPKPFFVMGDLNCTIFSAAYAQLADNGLSDVQLSAMETTHGNTHHPYPLHDGEKNIFYSAPLPKGDYRLAIDHMFVDCEHKSSLKCFSIITEQKALDTSDHCPIFLDYYFDMEK